MEFHNGTGWQSTKGFTLCINNCGFFGSAAMGNMCSKCHKDMLQKQEQAELTASSNGSIGTASSSENAKEHVVAGARDMHSGAVEASSFTTSPESTSTGNSAIFLFKNLKMNVKEGPNRCTTCRKRVGLTGFNCRCGNLFCAVHRYADKHDCPVDYRTANQAALAKRHPIF